MTTPAERAVIDAARVALKEHFSRFGMASTAPGTIALKEAVAALDACTEPDLATLDAARASLAAAERERDEARTAALSAQLALGAVCLRIKSDAGTPDVAFTDFERWDERNRLRLTSTKDALRDAIADARSMMVERDALLAEVEACRAALEEVGYTGSLPEGAWDRLHARIAPLDRRVAQLEAEAGHHDHWHAFGARVWRWLAENWETEDGWELAEIAVLAGLAEHVKYDPDIHGECGAEPGDDIIYPLRGDPAFAALAGAPEREETK